MHTQAHEHKNVHICMVLGGILMLFLMSFIHLNYLNYMSMKLEKNYSPDANVTNKTISSLQKFILSRA